MRGISSFGFGKGLADLSINLSSGWLGVLLISPGFYRVSMSKYIELLFVNLPPAIFTFLLGVFLAERSES